MTNRSYLNYHEEVALGNNQHKFPIYKFGAAPSGIQTTATDIWARANATPTQSIWLAPTAARIHTISSDSASDVSTGTGTTSVTVYYLPDWDSRETSETVTGDIDTGVAMTNSAVTINRMIANPQATTTAVGVNAGTIIATAASDATISAVILPNEGQTQQAILGFPSIQTLLLYDWVVGIDKATGAVASADFQLRFNADPETAILSFRRIGDLSAQSTGSNGVSESFRIPRALAGPGILKVQGIASANDLDGEASFTGVLVDN